MLLLFDDAYANVEAEDDSIEAADFVDARGYGKHVSWDAECIK
jgi:hypothetical protein